LREEGFDAYVTQSGTLYKVQVGAFAIRENAERLAAQLKAAGYEVLIAP
ncbi:MAG: SPOR domain-containing protein, partial [Bacillati bacterium ANGP1]